MPRKALRNWRLREIDAEGAHVQAVEEGGEVLVEAAQRLVQQL
jgi:hypothetical protein